MALVDKYKNFILDCDGVIWTNEAIEGSIETILELKRKGKKVVLVTNSSMKSKADYSRKISAMGCHIEAENINTSGSATAEYLSSSGFTTVYLIGESGLRDELESAGLKVINKDGEQKVDNMTTSHFKNVRLDPSVDTVVVGLDTGFTYQKLVMASLYVQNGAKLVGTNEDGYDRIGGRNMPGTGCLLAAVERSLQQPMDDPCYKPTLNICGKPNADFMKSILQKYGFEREETLMVGDRLDTDIEFGNSCNVDTLLVLSGVTQPHVLSQLDDDHFQAPTHVRSCLQDILSECAGTDPVATLNDS